MIMGCCEDFLTKFYHYRNDIVDVVLLLIEKIVESVELQLHIFLNQANLPVLDRVTLPWLVELVLRGFVLCIAAFTRG